MFRLTTPSLPYKGEVIGTIDVSKIAKDYLRKGFGLVSFRSLSFVQERERILLVQKQEAERYSLRSDDFLFEAVFRTITVSLSHLPFFLTVSFRGHPVFPDKHAAEVTLLVKTAGKGD